MSEPSIPASVTRWATNPLDASDLVEPDNTTKDEGWHEAQEPSHSFLNYWMHVVYLWLAYLDGLPAEAMTWTGAHVFNNDVTMTAGLDADNIAVSGTLTTNEFHATGAMVLDTTLDVTGLATFHGGATVSPGQTLTAEDATLTGEVDVGTLIVSGGTSLQGLSVAGSTAAQAVTATTVDASGAVTAGGSVTSGDSFEHSVPETRRKFISPLDFVYKDNRTPATSALWLLDADSKTIMQSLAANAGNALAAQIEVPAGATITKIDLLMSNNDISSRTFDATVVLVDAPEDNTTIPTAAIMTSGNATANLSIGSVASKQWIDVPLDADFTPSPNGFLSIRLDNASGTGPFVYGARVRYTYSTVHPAV